MLLQLDGITKRFGGRTLFEDLALVVRPGDRVGLLGPNGVGKTTLLRMIAENDGWDDGQIHRAKGIRVGLLRQEIDPGREHSVHAEVASSLTELDALEAELRELEGLMAQHGEAGREIPADEAERYDRCHSAFEFAGGFEREARVDRILDGLGFDEARRAAPLSTFSGGWLMRVELAKLLLVAPDLLLLDEPTNHLDLPSLEWFDETLTKYRGAAILVSHDRTFLRRHVTRVAELGPRRFDVYEATYDKYLDQKVARQDQLLSRKRSQDREIAQTERFIQRFRAKSTKARQVQSRIRALDKIERVEVVEDRARKMRLRIPAPIRSGESVLRLDGIEKSYGENVVYRGIDFEIRRGERVALAGPNGAGKSTLLRIAAGELGFDAGARKLGHKVEVGFFAQHQLEVLDTSRTILAELESIAQIDDYPRLRSHLGAFLFSGDDVDKKVGVLSGGEKARLALAKMLLRPSNFLVLDEPTNHLDVVACEVLETALREYAGTLLLISHDRSFINALATRVVDVRGGTLRDYPGNYDAYLRKFQAGDGTAEPAVASTVAASKQDRMAARERSKAGVRTQSKARKKLSKLEETIPRLEGELESATHRLGDPEVYRDGEAVRQIETDRTRLRAEIDAAYREWEVLAAELESND